jgi:hypothetical protein
MPSIKNKLRYHRQRIPEMHASCEESPGRRTAPEGPTKCQAVASLLLYEYAFLRKRCRSSGVSTVHLCTAWQLVAFRKLAVNIQSIPSCPTFTACLVVKVCEARASDQGEMRTLAKEMTILYCGGGWLCACTMGIFATCACCA